ncbi:MAG: F0F1 ATP synthase subunit alpha, partial [Sphingobacteriia bacterium]|nr:F0F1 ATP synthase subunit alpha [Sphingobacteriia bacterium]
DEDTRKKLERGKRLYELLKQDQYQPLAVAKQVLIYWSLLNGHLDNIPVEKIRNIEAGLYQYADLNNEVLNLIFERKQLDEEIEEKMKLLVEDYKATVDYLIK